MTDEADRNNGRFTAGNPGRPRGSRNRATLIAQRLLDEGTEEVVNAVLRAAAEGDMGAAKLCLDRLLPPLRARRIELADVPAVQSAADVPAAMAEVLRAVVGGELTPDEGRALADIVEANRKAIETTEILVRLERLEEALAKASGHGR